MPRVKPCRHHINIKAGESFQVGDSLVVLEHKSGSIARLLVLADASVKVLNPDELQEARRSGPLKKGASDG